MDAVPELGAHLFPFQRDLTAWALRRGRAAIFANTGLGKMRMELTWARAVAAHTGGKVLVLAPLAVASQLRDEGARIEIPARVCREGSEELGDTAIAITNYDRLHRFDPSRFAGVVLDESGCIKHSDAKTFRTLTNAFAGTPWRLAATATPAPNDWTELGTHAEFLGICTRAEMLAEYFCHDGGETQVWRLKRHARAAFWRWVASWGALVRMPSDLGYSDEHYLLPPLQVVQHTLAADTDSVRASGLLFAQEARTLNEQRAARRGSLSQRVQACVARVNADKEPWLVWCDLNAESEALADAIPDAVEVRGSDDVDAKERALLDFMQGRARVLVTKGSIAGWGLNFQHCARMAFVGVSHSWELWYQAIRRCYRFGQTRPVEVHVYTSELEGAVVANLLRKDQDARAMADALSTETRHAVRAAIHGATRATNDYHPKVPMTVPAWLRTEAL
jgi:superfamily II DNA or RNA helicase